MRSIFIVTYFNLKLPFGLTLSLTRRLDFNKKYEKQTGGVWHDITIWSDGRQEITPSKGE